MKTEYPISFSEPRNLRIKAAPENTKPMMLFTKVRSDAILPEYQSDQACGCDLHVCTDGKDITSVEDGEKNFVYIHPGQMYMVKTGLVLEIVSQNAAAFIYSRSGLGAKQGLVVAQGVGVIDPDYRGELCVPLRNLSNEAVKICYGDRVAQLVIMAFTQANIAETTVLSETARGGGGFGSTGK